MTTSNVSSGNQPLEPLAREGEHVAPTFRGEAFHCMHCGVLAAQVWHQLAIREPYNIYEIDYCRCICQNCSKASIWNGSSYRCVDPTALGGPRPHLEMPEDVRSDYEEARTIVALSPRGACALLRLAVHKLCRDLGESGKNIDGDIASLVDKGLASDVQEALDSLRVIGNNAVHPGEMDLKDDTETATALFSLLNFIVDDRIAQPKKRKAIFERLPKGAKEAIQRRDGKNKTTSATAD